MKARVSLNLPNSLKKAAEDFAAKDGVSLNQYVALALAEKIGARGAAEFFEERSGHGAMVRKSARSFGAAIRVGAVSFTGAGSLGLDGQTRHARNYVPAKPSAAIVASWIQFGEQVGRSELTGMLLIGLALWGGVR